MEIGLSLGSNLGDRLENLRCARELISAIPTLSRVACSPAYEADPVDVPSEYAGMPFLNAVLIADVSFDVESMHNRLVVIERTMGRQKSGIRNSPRSIDIDIVYAGNIVVKAKELEIPHPRWSGRRFVVQPLADLRPDLKIPGESRTLREVLLALPSIPKVLLFSQQW